MSVRKGTIPVLAAPMIDPGRDRITLELPAGLSVAEIVDQILPGRSIAREHVRVALVTKDGSQIVPPEVWHRAYPHAGVHVVIRVVPGRDALRTILTVVVAVAAIAIGNFFAGTLLGLTAGSVGYGLASGAVALGVTLVGNLLINALIPPSKPDDQERQNRYSISGWRNRMDPNGAVPVVLGEIRYAPPFGALSCSEIVGDDLYIRSMLNFGYGPLALEDFRIGETSLSEYDEVEIEVRDGVAGDPPLGLFARQVLEETIGADLTMPYPRDDLGEIIDGSDPVETPVTRSAGADAIGAAVIFAWPAGLFRANDEGKLRNSTVVIKILQRLVQAEEWQEVTTLTITAKKREAFYRQHTWDYPARGRYQIRCVMMTPETTKLDISNRTAWAALQTIRPEYPLNFSEPLALAAVRIKSTHQLNGQLDSFNALCRRVCLDYDHASGEWVERATRNPAALYRYALQSPANPRPVDDLGIDVEALEDWHDFCRLKDLKYDAVLDDAGMSLRDALAEIAAAGRATPRHDGRRWSVVVDRPADLPIIDDYGPRNSSGFKLSRSYYHRPDGLRIKFLDQTNDNKPTERIVPWPGHVGEIKLTEALEMPGKTDPVEIFREGTRRMYEAMWRPDVYRISLDGPLSPATRGDKVRLSADTIERTQVSARVKRADGQLVELDELVTMVSGENYAIRFRTGISESDTIGTSIVRTVVNVPGETPLLVLEGSGAVPAIGDLVFFGIAGRESFELIVSGIEAGEDFSQHVKMIDAAPIIDQLVDALEIPPWSGRVGTEIPENLTAPPAPRFTSVESGFAGTDTENLISVTLVPGSGPIATAQFTIEHRTGAGAWTPVTIPVANGGLDITGYTRGTIVEIRAFALSAVGVAGPVTPIVTITVGEGDADIPGGLDPALISIGALLGGAVAAFSTSDDARTTKVQLYRSSTTVLNRATDAVGAPLAVLPSRSYSIPDGDTTRSTLIANGNMDTAASWTLGTGWSIGSGVASHAAGTASSLYQTCALVSGKWYRVAYTLSGVTAGSVFPRLGGGTARNGTTQTANGSYSDRIQAVTGNNFFAFVGLADFVGSADNAVLFEETATCLAAGTYYYWLEPQNADGLPGPVAGPFTVTIR